MIFTLVVAAVAVSDAAPILKLKSGTVGGISADGVDRFLGVPFAEPPVGELRWQPTQHKQPFEGIWNASEFSADCPQTPDFSSFFPEEQSEDCLYLNYWRPVNGTNLPVLVFVHGGSFTAGSGSGNDWPVSPLYQGISFAKHNAALVTFNYRLGLFGFLGGAAVKRRTVDHSHGNFGLQDSMMVLKWLRANNQTLGIDPERVFLFGESSGASIVSSLMVAPQANKLFSMAGMESGSYDNATVQPNPNAIFRNVSLEAGCLQHNSDEALQCLLSRSLLELRPAQMLTDNAGYWGPTVDRVVLPAAPERLAARGKFNELVAVLLGSNVNEGRLLVSDIDLHANSTDLETWVETCGYFPPQLTSQITDFYPCQTGKDGCWKAACSMWTDSQFVCPARRSARWIDRATSDATKVFLYQVGFAPRSYTNFLALTSGVTPRLAGIPHGGELPMVFNDTNWVTSPPGRYLTRAIMSYYTSLAFTGDANTMAGNHTRWPIYHTNTDQSLMLGIPILQQTHLRKKYCDFWDNVVLPTPP